MREVNWGVCVYVRFFRFFGSDLMGYNYEGSHCVWIPRIGVRDVIAYEGSVPALAMAGSKLVTVDLAFFWVQPVSPLRAIAKGKV